MEKEAVRHGMEWVTLFLDTLRSQASDDQNSWQQISCIHFLYSSMYDNFSG